MRERRCPKPAPYRRVTAPAAEPRHKQHRHPCGDAAAGCRGKTARSPADRRPASRPSLENAEITSTRPSWIARFLRNANTAEVHDPEAALRRSISLISGFTEPRSGAEA
jgi:hypothetical protein